MVVGGQEGPEFGDAVFYGPVFSDDCVHSAYIALDASGGGYKVIEVHDGKTATELKLRLHGLGATYPFVEGAILSPDAQKLACIVAAGGQAFFAAKTARAHRRIIVTGQEGEDYDALEISLGFSSDGRHLVYSVRGGVGSNKSSVVVDGKAGKLYDDVIGWTLVKDSSGGMGVAYIAREGRKFYRVFQPLA